MASWPEQLREDIENARDSVKKARMDLTGGLVEERAKETGKDLSSLVGDTWEDLVDRLERLQRKVRSNAYEFSEDLQDNADDIVLALKDIQASLRERRRSITGGRLEDAVVRALEEAEERLDRLFRETSD